MPYKIWRLFQINEFCVDRLVYIWIDSIAAAMLLLITMFVDIVLPIAQGPASVIYYNFTMQQSCRLVCGRILEADSV